MERKETLSTRDLTGDTRTDDETREPGRFESDEAEAARFERDETEAERDRAGTTETEAARFERDETEAGRSERDESAVERDGATAAGGAPSAEPEDRGAEPRSTAAIADDDTQLLPRDENERFHSRWETIQTGFVDEPRQTVEQADELVAEVMKRLAEGFADERTRLEQQWGRGEDVSTEDLRIALQRYRAFFQRLLSA
jgi:hypothetical protein